MAASFDAAVSILRGKFITNNHYDDLIIEIPGYTLEGTNTDSGAVNFIRGSQEGLTLTGNQLWTQDGGCDSQGTYLGDLYDNAEDDDFFGDTSP